jgi:MIP family channel proteins
VVINEPVQEMQRSDIEGSANVETIRSLLRPASAELIGSALFIFIACGANISTPFVFVGSKTIGTALTFGMTIFVLAYAIGHISGGHLNFAVTFTFCLMRRISITRCLFYFVAQWIGGLIGIGFLMAVTPAAWQSNCYANNQVHGGLTSGHAFVVEFVLTFYLMFVVMASSDSRKSNQTLIPFAIGMTVFICHMLALPVTGCSINPTRSFATAAAANSVASCKAFENHWVFWLAPLLGASLAGFIYEYCFHDGGFRVDRLIDRYIARPQTNVQ